MADLKRNQSSDSENHGDRETPADPNAMGPVARAVAVPTASPASGLCDDHDSDIFRLPMASHGIWQARGKL